MINQDDMYQKKLLGYPEPPRFVSFNYTYDLYRSLLSCFHLSLDFIVYNVFLLSIILYQNICFINPTRFYGNQNIFMNYIDIIFCQNDVMSFEGGIKRSSTNPVVRHPPN